MSCMTASVPRGRSGSGAANHDSWQRRSQYDEQISHFPPASGPDPLTQNGQLLLLPVLHEPGRYESSRDFPTDSELPQTAHLDMYLSDSLSSPTQHEPQQDSILNGLLAIDLVLQNCTCFIGGFLPFSRSSLFDDGR